MPDIGVFHPIIVHFVIAMLVVGIGLRWIWFTGKVPFAGSAAATLLLIGTLAAVLAVKSGEDGHGPAERIPGARPAVEEHEEWGERTRNLFLVIAALEIAALVLADRRYKKGALVASAVLGLAGLFAIYETGEHGGELVYSYTGGVGTRYGENEDTQRLLLAGLYHQSVVDRQEGRAEDAARLIEEMARRFPDNQGVAIFAIESLILDRDDGQAALAALARLPAPEDNRGRSRAGMLQADAYLAAGFSDSAHATLEELLENFPDDQRIKDRLAQFR